MINEYLNENILNGVTCKTFRTYNASRLFQEELNKHEIKRKKNYFNV